MNDYSASMPPWRVELTQQRERIAELEKGLEIALPILRSAVKQQWDGAYNAFAICSSLLKGQGKC